jgi:hypothetical protein
MTLQLKRRSIADYIDYVLRVSSYSEMQEERYSTYLNFTKPPCTFRPLLPQDNRSASDKALDLLEEVKLSATAHNGLYWVGRKL